MLEHQGEKQQPQKTSEGRFCFFVLQSQKLIPRSTLDQLPLFSPLKD